MLKYLIMEDTIKNSIPKLKIKRHHKILAFIYYFFKIVFVPKTVKTHIDLYIAHHREHKAKIVEKAWFFFKWEMFAIVLVAFITAVLNEIPIWLQDSETTNQVLRFPLRNNIVYSTITMILTIAFAIFVGVFSEMGKYIGRYGSAIFVLVPLFVWLFSERGEKEIGMTRVLEMSQTISDVMFWSVVGSIGIFFFGTIIHESVVFWQHNVSKKHRLEFLYNYTNRLILMLINILMVLIMSIALINYALFSLHLGDLTADEKQHLINVGIPANEIYPINFSNNKIVVFHSVITAGFGLIMVLIGLVGTFNSRKTVMVFAEEATTAEHTITEEEFEKENEAFEEIALSGDDDISDGEAAKNKVRAQQYIKKDEEV